MQAIIQAFAYASMMWGMCTSNTFNMQQCLSNHDEWLWPEVVKGIELTTGVRVPYQDEHLILKRLQPTQSVYDRA